jgi:hypothetical protein
MPERAAADIHPYSAPGRGGHFLAFEEPRLIADDLDAFMRSIGGWYDVAPRAISRS